MYYMGLIITSLLRQTDVETLASVHKKVDFELRQLSASTTNFNMGKLLDLWCKTVEHVDEIHRVKFIVSMKAFQNENILTRPELHAYESTCINSNTCWTRIHFGWSAAGSDSFCCQGKLLDGCSGGRFKNTYELLNPRALKISMLYKNRIFQCMGKIFCVEFQRFPGGRFKNTYELLNPRALKISMLYKNRIFQCMGKIFCVEFQRFPLKFHTKYLIHRLKDMIFIKYWNFKSS